MTKAHSRMPVVFFGHGSPMNTLERNKYTETWRKLGESIPRPKAILCVSAHWYTEGTAVTAMEKPKTIHDFYGFPQALFNVQYPAPGDPRLAARVRELLEPVEFERLGEYARLAVPTPEHYLPLLYIAALQGEDEQMSFAVDGYEMGSLGMLTAAAGMPAS